MAKKRSKTSKQRQAKAAASRRGPKVAAAATVGGRMLQSGKNSTAKVVVLASAGRDCNKKESNRQEQLDFEKQMKGLQERAAWNRHRRNNDSAMIRDKKKSTTPFFQKATFDLKDKHHQINKTTQLIEQTTQSLMENRLLGGDALSQSSQVASSDAQPSLVQRLPLKSNKLQIMAAQQRLAWEEESNLECDNPYAALAASLDENDDNDEIIHAQAFAAKQQLRQPSFQFAPPSFAVQSSNTDYTTTTTFISPSNANHYPVHMHSVMDDDEMDPDL